MQISSVFVYKKKYLFAYSILRCKVDKYTVNNHFDSDKDNLCEIIKKYIINNMENYEL